MTRRADTFSRTNDFSFSPSPSSSFASFSWSGHAYYDRFLLHKCVVGCVHVCGFLVPLLATVAASTQTRNVFDAPDNGDSHKYIAELRIAVRSTRPIRRSKRTKWEIKFKIFSILSLLLWWSVDRSCVKISAYPCVCVRVRRRRVATEASIWTNGHHELYVCIHVSLNLFSA